MVVERSVFLIPHMSSCVWGLPQCYAITNQLLAGKVPYGFASEA